MYLFHKINWVSWQHPCSQPCRPLNAFAFHSLGPDEVKTLTVIELGCFAYLAASVGLYTCLIVRLCIHAVRNLAYYGHSIRKQGNCLEKEIMHGTVSGARRRGRPRMAWINNIKTWTGLPVEESVRMTDDRDKW